MPLVMQHWNIYRSHAVANWLQKNGIPVIANVRWGDERTYDVCCAGVPKKSTIAVGSHGCMKSAKEQAFFSRGFSYVISALMPKTVIIYGSTPNELFDKYRQSGIHILQFDSECSIAHQKVVCL